MLDTGDANGVDADIPQTGTFPFLKLPRELRDQIYHHTFALQDERSQRALRIERRNLKYFEPTAPAILLILHHEYLLLNRQVAREALEVLFKRHTVFLSCGPFVLKTLLERIERDNGPGRQWLKWIKDIELDWVTFPNLSFYPPDREEGRDEWYWEQQDEEDDQVEVDVDYIRGGGAQYHGHYDEYDHEGYHYDDNFYDPSDVSLYPAFRHPPTTQVQVQTHDTDDPLGLAAHNPYQDPSHDPAAAAAAAAASPEDMATKLDLLISMEVSPLFTYFASPTFALTSITLPLYFISKQSHYDRTLTRPGYTLPLKIRYWVHVCIHALALLASSSASSSSSSSSTTAPKNNNNNSALPLLQQVRVKYLPWDVWASMDPADDLARLIAKGVWLDGPDDGEGSAREGEGAAFRAVWAGLGALQRETMSGEEEQEEEQQQQQQRMGLKAAVTLVPWDGNVDSWRVGDELEVVFMRSAG